MRKALVALSVVLLTGCFEIENSINLKKDLSGTADFHLGIDLEPMIMIMAHVGRKMEGKSGPMTDAELAKAKVEFKKSSKKSEAGAPPSRAEMEKSLPKGVTLIDFAVKEREFGVVSDFKFGFDRIDNLIDVSLPSKKSEDPTQKSVIDTPFEGLELIEKGDTITLQTKPQNPADTVKEQAADTPMDSDAEEMLQTAFRKMRVAYRITAPFTIVSHNATRKEGNTLIWEYDMKRFEQIAASKKAEDMRVRVTYKR